MIGDKISGIIQTRITGFTFIIMIVVKLLVPHMISYLLNHISI